MIEKNYFWSCILFLAIGTFAIRFSIISISSKIKISDRMKSIFSYIPVSILPALIAPMVFFHKGQVSWLVGKERFFVLLVATIVCFLTRSMIATIAFGLTFLYLLTQL